MIRLRFLFLLYFFQWVYNLEVNVTVEMFKTKAVRGVTGFLCNETEMVQTLRGLSKLNIMSNFPMSKMTTYKEVSSAIWEDEPFKIGIIVDMKCNYSQDILQVASENRLFDIKRFWLLMMEERLRPKEFEKVSIELEPDMFDIYEYLENGTSEMEYAERMREFSADINYGILHAADVKEMMEKRAENRTRSKEALESKFAIYVNLKAIIDSEVTIVAPGKIQGTYDLFEIHRKTVHTRMLIQHVGTLVMKNGIVIESNLKKNMAVSAVLGRKNFNNTLMRSASALLQYDYFSRSTEVPPKPIDYWTTMSMQITVLTEEQFNFRMVVKMFDDYGFAVNGGYTGLVKFMGEQRLDMVSTGMFHITSRMGAVDYISSLWRNRNCLIFKQPPLSQITNVFRLPFSTNVWIATFCLMIACGILIQFQFRSLKKANIYDEGNRLATFPDVYTFLTGVAFQQGTDLYTNFVSARITMLVFLIGSLFLFTSYTANIVVLLQSPANSINTIRQFLDSSLEMGYENLPYEENLIEEETDPLVRELYEKKLKPKGAHGPIYDNSTYGMSRVRQGLYAFHLEQPTAARIVRSTFTDSEMCTLKTIAIFPYRIHGHSAPKKSAYFEFFAQAYRWYTEAGFVERTEKRFTHQLPKCTGKGTGFNSVGIVDVKHIIVMWTYGIAAAFLLLCLENLHYNFQNVKMNKRQIAFDKKPIKVQPKFPIYMP